MCTKVKKLTPLRLALSNSNTNKERRLDVRRLDVCLFILVSQVYIGCADASVALMQYNTAVHAIALKPVTRQLFYQVWLYL